MVLIRQMPEGTGIKDLNKIASTIEEALRSGGEPTVVVGIGTVATHLRDLAKSYKEAQIAIEVGKVFDTEKYVINYENLGIGRLIYQLPTTAVRDVPAGSLQEEPHRRPGQGDAVHHPQVL